MQRSALRKHSFRVAGIASLVGTLVLVIQFPDGSFRARAAGPSSPSIVLIVTDDQRWDTLWAMPKVQDQIVRHGLTFTNGFVVNPLCCPSRASIFTGQYSHSTGVYTNSSPYGGYSAFGDSSTIATWLDGAGYRTGLVGKYLNEYSGTKIPPGWDSFIAISGKTPNHNYYYGYTLNRNGVLKTYGVTPSAYSTDVFAADAEAFIRSAPSGPLFLYFAPWAPHQPPIPAPRHATAFSGLGLWRPPNYNEADVSDKPAWVRSHPPLDAGAKSSIDSLRLNQYRTLLAVDEAINRIVAALSATGRLSSTMIVFTSDNGFSWGEHRWANKQAAFEEDARVPLVVRYDPLTSSPRSDSHLALNIDFAPTLADLVGVQAPGAEGVSLLPLLAGGGADWRETFLIEHMFLSSPPGGPPTYCAVRTERYTYVNYANREEELYDIVSDPYQLRNRAYDPRLHSTLVGLKGLLKAMCDPPPPGYTLPP